jgi:uncharacterized damage-inducible protein DinB
MKSIVTATQQILSQLRDLATKLSDEQYTGSLTILMNNSIGKHFRHIIEFYDILLSGTASGALNYDKRQHDPTYESNRDKTISKLDELLNLIIELPDNQNMELSVNYDLDSDETEKVHSNLARELTYNVEHAIHHMAIIRIGLETGFPGIEIDPHFGYAYSTIKHLNQ